MNIVNEIYLLIIHSAMAILFAGLQYCRSACTFVRSAQGKNFFLLIECGSRRGFILQPRFFSAQTSQGDDLS